jgi:hypothetical protein
MDTHTHGVHTGTQWFNVNTYADEKTHGNTGTH